MRVGFAGAGNIAAAIARGWAGAGAEGPAAMLFSDLDAARAEALAADVGGETRPSLAELRDDADVIFLAVKPAALDAVASELDGSVPALVSVLAATPIARLAAAFPGVPILRLMPNQPVEVRRGVICHPPPSGMGTDLATELYALLELLGERVELPEEQIDTAMAVMSCSPAYVAAFAEALASAGSRAGLERTVALRLVASAIGGTGELLQRRDPANVMSAVASPGGTTEEGLRALEAGGFNAAVEAAVDASLERFR